MNAPGFWDDQAHAAQVSAEHARTTRRLEGYRTLVRDYDDARELASMDGGDLDAEIAASLRPLRDELARLQEAALFDGEYDAGDAVVTLQSGTGGTDAQDWTEMMLRMYERWGADRGFDVELLEASPGEEAGLKSSTFTVGGENAYGILKAERGKHRLVRQSPFDAAHRRHTSFALVEVMPEAAEDVALDINPEEIKFEAYRSGGPGGQNVNKVNTAVRLTHVPTGIVVTCQTERSQLQNRETAMRMLKARLLEQEQERRESERAALRGEHAETSWGSQIRSYVLHPYNLVKDLRTGYETSDTAGVLDGELDPFMNAYLAWQVGREPVTSK